MAHDVKGVYAAPLMPLQHDLQPDLDRYITHCRQLLAQGCHGLMPLGSTGEAHSFSVEERMRIMDALAGSGLDTAQMLIGTSALAYPDTVRLMRHALSMHAGRVCVQPAFYYKPTDDGLYAYYARLIEAVADNRLRLLIYDWAANTGVHFSLEVLRRLFADFRGIIVGIKDSNGDAALLQERRWAFPDIELFGGTDSAALSAMRAGGMGLMSALANILAPEMCAIYEHWHDEAGAAAQTRVDAILAIVRHASFFASLKAVVAQRTGDDAWRRMRPPLHALSEREAAVLGSQLRRLGCELAA